MLAYSPPPLYYRNNPYPPDHKGVQKIQASDWPNKGLVKR